MEPSEIKQMMLGLVELSAQIKELEEKKEVIRKQITDWMILNESNLLTIPNQCKVFLQSKDSFINYPFEITELKKKLDTLMKEAQLNGQADRVTTKFIKLELIKPETLELITP